jgi:hypothetical protein
MKPFHLFIRSWGMSLLTILLLAGGFTAVYADNDDDNDHRGKDSRIKIGREIAPVPLNLQGKNRNMVWKGSYLVNAGGGCNDCHTFPSFAAGGDPFAAQFPVINSAKYLAGGTPFGPNLKSKNLTPDINGRPAGLTYEQFETTLRTGRDAEDGHILQVMPWPVYGKLADQDLRAIYEYLRAIPSLPNNY